MKGISGTVINEVFRQIKAGKVTINTSAEFCRTANKHVPSMKPLFQRTIDILEEQNDIAYSPPPIMIECLLIAKSLLCLMFKKIYEGN